MKKNIPRLYFFSFFTMFFVSIPIWVPYFQQYGFSMQDIFVVQSIFAFCVAAFEVPSGYFCDLFGRRRTLIAGGVFYGVAFTWLAFATTFWGVVLFEVLAAMAFSLISGADVALLYDSLDEEVTREQKGKILGNVQFSQLISEAGGALLGGYLATYSLALPFKVQAILSWFPLIIALSLVEGQRVTMARGQHKENFMLVFRHIFLGQTSVRTSFLQLLIWGLSTFMAVWTLQKYWEEQQVPLAYFGILWASANLVAALTSKYAAHLQVKVGQKIALLLSCAFPVMGYLGMGLSGGVLGVVFSYFLYIGRGLIQVNFREEFNHHLPNHFRATANSIQSFCFRAVFALTGPLVGLSIDQRGLDQSLLFLGVIFLGCYTVAFINFWNKK